MDLNLFCQILLQILIKMCKQSTLLQRPEFLLFAWRMGSEDIRFQRKALNLIQYLLQENSLDCIVVSELGFPQLMTRLDSSSDMGVREAALGGLLQLARDRTSGSGSALAKEDKLRQALQNRIEGISSLAPDDVGTSTYERHPVDKLWCARGNEPSSLQEKGLVVLSGEEASHLSPDVAGQFFERSL